MTDPFLPLSYGAVLELVLDLDGEVLDLDGEVLDLDGEELVLEWRKRAKRKM